jgi:hypothetical protein
MTRKRALDFRLYIIIGLAIGIGAMVYASRSPSDEDVQLAVKWISLLAGTVIVFGLHVRKSMRSRSRSRFWLMALGLVTIHFVMFIGVSCNWPNLKLVWLFLFMWAESAALSRLTAGAKWRILNVDDARQKSCI